MSSRTSRTNVLTECMTIPRVCARGHGHESVRTVLCGRHRRYVSRVDAGVATTAGRSRRCERHHDRLRRHGLCSSQLFRQWHPDSEHRSTRWLRSSVHGVPHHCAVFAVACVAVDRTQSPLGRHARRIQLEHRVSEHAWWHHTSCSNDCRGVARTRVCDVVCRQVAPGADGRVHRGRTAHQLAATEGIRSLLRILER